MRQRHVRAASRVDGGSSWPETVPAHAAWLGGVSRACQHQQGTNESPEGREERASCACARALWTVRARSSARHTVAAAAAAGRGTRRGATVPPGSANNRSGAQRESAEPPEQPRRRTDRRGIEGEQVDDEAAHVEQMRLRGQGGADRTAGRAEDGEGLKGGGAGGGGLSAPPRCRRSVLDSRRGGQGGAKVPAARAGFCGGSVVFDGGVPRHRPVRS